mgnify:CR=1 FL=1
MLDVLCQLNVCVFLLYVCHRFVKGERFFPAEVPMVNTAGIGPVVPADDEQKMNGITQRRNLEGNEKLVENAPTFQARIVGQGYKQVYTLNHPFYVESHNVHTHTHTYMNIYNFILFICLLGMWASRCVGRRGGP